MCSCLRAVLTHHQPGEIGGARAEDGDGDQRAADAERTSGTSLAVARYQAAPWTKIRAADTE